MARRQVSIFINGKQVENQIKSIRSEKRKLTAELNRMTIGTAAYQKKARELARVNGILDDHRNRIRNTGSAWNKLTKGGITKIAGLAAGAFAVDRIVDYGTELFKLGNEMEVLGRKAATVFGDFLPQVTAAAEENANAMGLTIGQYTDAAAAIGDLLIPMGFQREEAANISTELVNLSGALSEWTGGQIKAEEVTKILGKAVLGEREQLKTLGISIQEADVKARLAEKGLSNLTGEMLQQAKAAATLELITEKSVDAQAAYAENSDTNVRRTAELRAQLQTITETIATALIPVFNRLLKEAQPIIAWLGDFIAGLLGAEDAQQKSSAITKILVGTLRTLGKSVQFVYQLFVAVGGFLLDTLGPAIEGIAVRFTQFTNTIKSGLNGLSELAGLEVRFDQTSVEDVKAAFAEMRKAREDSKIDDPITTADTTSNTGDRIPGGGSSGGGGSAATDQRIKDLQRLQQALEKYYQQADDARLGDEERALAAVQRRYQKEIDLALALEAQGVTAATEARKELERLRDAELLQLRLDQNQARFEAEGDQRLQQELERQAQEEEFALARAEANRQIQEVTRQTVLSEEELAMIELQEYYNGLIALAEKYGLDTLDIEIAFRKEQERIRREFDEKAVKETAQTQQELAQNYAQTFGTLANVIGSAIDLAGKKSKEATALQKLLTLAQIGLSSAAAIAQATAAGAAAGPFPANLAAIATGVATVLGNIAQARAVFAEVPQFFEGGWTHAKGAQDGRTYRAKYIGQPSTGRLPGHAVLMDTSIGRVLASERGSEYFVSNAHMRNPMVLNHVQAIDNIVRYRQFAEGGATNPVAVSPTEDSTAELGEVTMALNASIQQLNAILSGKLYAVIDNQTILDIRDQMEKIQQASGGVA